MSSLFDEKIHTADYLPTGHLLPLYSKIRISGNSRSKDLGETSNLQGVQSTKKY